MKNSHSDDSPGEAHNDRILESVYGELRRLAEARLAGAGAGASLVPTELVHEAYLRLQANGDDFERSGEYLAVAAQAMRHILVDRARARGALKRGGKKPLSLNDEPASEERPHELLALDEALTALEQKDERLALLVKLRYYAGLTLDQTAAAMDTSASTVQRDWQLARSWLRIRLRDGDEA